MSSRSKAVQSSNFAELKLKLKQFALLIGINSANCVIRVTNDVNRR